MTTNASEFPCIEIPRCLVAEAEMGMRLTVKAASSDSENSHIPDFTEGKSLKEEWYMQFEVAQSEEEGQVTPQRFLQLRHRETSQYLMSNENGRVSCTPTSSESTWWIMQRVGSNDALAAGENGVSDATKSASPESAEDQYILISRKNPLRRLCCTKGFEGSGQDFMLIASKQPGTQPSIWTLKFTSGELCYVVNPVVHHHMRCNMYGNLSLTSQSNAWEIFRFVEVGNGDVYISSWTHFSKFLSSNSDGKVYTVDHESTSPGYSERWRLESPPKGNGLYIRNVASRRYLSVGKTRNQHLWTTTKLNDYAVWHLDAPQLHIYYLTSLFASTQKETDDDESLKETSIDPNQLYFQDGFDDVHVSSRKEGPCLSKKKEGEEEWKVEVTPEGYFTFFSVLHEKYLGCNSKGDVHTTTSKGAWTLWEKQASPYGGVTFKSKEHGRFLAVTKTNNALHTTEGDKETDLRHSWRIDPRIPRIVTGGTGAFIAGAMGYSHSVNMPFAVLGAMEGAQSSELLKNTVDLKDPNGATDRPISSWKSWVKADPNWSPPLVISPSLSFESSQSVTDTPREASGEKESNGKKESESLPPGKPHEKEDEKKSADSTSDDKPNEDADEEGDII